MDLEKLKATDGTGPAVLASITADRAIAATTIEVDSVDNWPDEFIVCTGTLNASGFITEASLTEMVGHLDGGNIEIDSFVPGYNDVGNTENQVAVIKPTGYWADQVQAALDTLQTQKSPTGVVEAFAGAVAPAGWLLCDGAAVSRATYADLFDVVAEVFGAGNGTTTFNVPDLRSRVPIGADQGTFSFTFASGDVNTGTDQITVTANEELYTGRKVQLTTTGTLPTGLALATDYYVIVVDSTHIKLASSLALAVAGTGLDLTAAGAGTNTATGSLTDRDLGKKGGEETHALRNTEIPHHTHGVGFYANTGHTGSGFNTADAGGGDGTFQTGNGTGGNGAHNNLPPFLALNYIIKT